MSAGFALLCVGSAVVSLSILWILYGPTKTTRVAPVTRASSGVPEYVVPRASGATYQPEAVFAVENNYRLALAAQVAHVVPAPAPPRTRMARGSGPPPIPRREQTHPEANPFLDEGATYVG